MPALDGCDILVHVMVLNESRRNVISKGRGTIVSCREGVNNQEFFLQFTLHI